MKKFIIILISILIVAIAWVYLFIPSQIVIKKEMLLFANPQGTYRVLSNEKTWRNWMTDSPHGNSGSNSSSLYYNNSEFRVYNRLMNGMEVVISDGKNPVVSSLNVIPISVDSCILEWRSVLTAQKNPFNRLSKYLLAKKTGKNMNEILSKMRTFLEEGQNIYHLDIFRRLVKDTVFMSTRSTFSHYPSTVEIYAMIAKVKQYIQQLNGKETNSPMLNAQIQSDSTYDVMVAIPVDHALPEKGEITLKRMPFKGNMLEAEVSGGIHKINQGFSNFKDYVMDHRRTPAAIPYEMLITDRSQEPDTSKWVTKLFYPVY